MTSPQLDPVELLGRIVASIKHGCEDCPCCYAAHAIQAPAGYDLADHMESCPFWQADELLFVPVLLLPRPAP